MVWNRYSSAAVSNDVVEHDFPLLPSAVFYLVKGKMRGEVLILVVTHGLILEKVCVCV